MYCRQHRWRVVLIAGGSIAFIVAGAYLWGSIATWRTLETTTTERAQAVNQRIAALAQQRHTLEDLRVTTEDIAKQADQLCDMPAIIAWQRHLHQSLQDRLDHCDNERVTMQSTIEALQTISDRIESEQQLADGVANIQQQLADLPEHEYQQRKEVWEPFVHQVEELSLHASLKTTAAALTVATTDIIAGYTALIAADEAQDRAAFDAAVEATKKGYSKLGDMQNTSVESFTTLLDALVQQTE